jgi:hypothetical protein
MGSLFRPSLSQELQSQNTINLCGGQLLQHCLSDAGDSIMYRPLYPVMSPAASHLIHMIVAHEGKQATELCWPGIFWYARILRQIVVSSFNNSLTVT